MTGDLCQLWVPPLDVRAWYHPENDFLGAGTVGSVFRVSLELGDTTSDNEAHSTNLNRVFALKCFRTRHGRDDFENERKVCQFLATLQHSHIVTCIASWTEEVGSYMLLPMANCDLRAAFQAPRETRSAAVDSQWLLRQLSGLADALRCLHNYEGKPLADAAAGVGVVIGFHHDIKPGNILLFGTAEEVHSSQNSIYNRKASTGDPSYGAPEFALYGQVSRPKDIFSLGCVFLEVLVWLLLDEPDAIGRFTRARLAANEGKQQVSTACFWNQAEGTSQPSLSSPVIVALAETLVQCDWSPALLALHSLVESMLEISATLRPKASVLSHALQQATRVMIDGAQ